MLDVQPLPSRSGQRRVPVVALDFDDFYQAQWPAIVRLCTAVTRKQSVAEEIAQDAFLTAYRKWTTVSELEQPGAWVRRVALNRAVSVGRPLLAEARLMARIRRSDAVHTFDAGRDEVWSAVRSLPRRQAQVVALMVLEDRSVTDVADILSIDEDTVRSHWRRARVALATTINELAQEQR